MKPNEREKNNCDTWCHNGGLLCTLPGQESTFNQVLVSVWAGSTIWAPDLSLRERSERQIHMGVSIAPAYLGASVVRKQDNDSAATRAHRCFVLNAKVSIFSTYHIYLFHHSNCSVLTCKHLLTSLQHKAQRRQMVFVDIAKCVGLMMVNLA